MYFFYTSTIIFCTLNTLSITLAWVFFRVITFFHSLFFLRGHWKSCLSSDSVLNSNVPESNPIQKQWVSTPIYFLLSTNWTKSPKLFALPLLSIVMAMELWIFRIICLWLCLGFNVSVDLAIDLAIVFPIDFPFSIDFFMNFSLYFSIVALLPYFFIIFCVGTKRQPFRNPPGPQST